MYASTPAVGSLVQAHLDHVAHLVRAGAFTVRPLSTDSIERGHQRQPELRKDDIQAAGPELHLQAAEGLTGAFNIRCVGIESNVE